MVKRKKKCQNSSKNYPTSIPWVSPEYTLSIPRLYPEYTYHKENGPIIHQAIIHIKNVIKLVKKINSHKFLLFNCMPAKYFLKERKTNIFQELKSKFWREIFKCVLICFFTHMFSKKVVVVYYTHLMSHIDSICIRIYKGVSRNILSCLHLNTC